MDSPFAGITASVPHIRDALIMASFHAWRNLVDLCVTDQPDFLLLAGDIFDWADRSIRAQLAFREGCVRLGSYGIKVFVVHGNHDPLQGRYAAIELPENVHVFGHSKVESQVVKRQGSPLAVVSGISYQNREEKRNLASRFASCPIPPKLFSIGLVHANLGGSTGHAPYAPCSMSDLLSCSVDYWALGHVHQRHVVSKEPYVVYPGNIQGRSFHEQGERGAYLVHVRDGTVSRMDFKALDAVRFQIMETPIDPHNSMDSLVEHMADQLAQAVEKGPGLPMVCRFMLIGRGTLFSELIRPNAVDQILENIRDHYDNQDPFVWIENIRLQCQPEADMVELMESDGLLGRVLRDMADTESSPKEFPLLVQTTLNALFGRRLVTNAMGKPDENAVLEMMDQARNLCIDLLGTEDT